VPNESYGKSTDSDYAESDLRESTRFSSKVIVKVAYASVSWVEDVPV